MLLYKFKDRKLNVEKVITDWPWALSAVTFIADIGFRDASWQFLYR